MIRSLSLTLGLALGIAPAAAQSVPKSAIIGIGSGASATAAPVTINDGTQNVPWLQVNPTSHVVSHIGDGSAMTVTATGGTVARSLAARASDFVNVREKGAKGDGQLVSAVATIAAGSTNLTAQGATFAPADCSLVAHPGSGCTGLVDKVLILGNAGVAPSAGPVIAQAVLSPGAGYTATPACGIADGAGTGSGATCAALMSLQGATLVSGGFGCAADGSYDFVVGIDASPTAASLGTPATVTATVASGAVTAVQSVKAAGLLPGLGTISAAPGYGGNCSTAPTFSLSYGVAAIQITAQGAAYSLAQTSASLTGGSPTTAATLGGVSIGAPVPPLKTTIVGYTSPTQVTLAASAGSTLSAATVQLAWATDDQAAIQAAINDAITAGGSGGVWVPAGIYWIGSKISPAPGPLVLRGSGRLTSTLLWDSGTQSVQNGAGWSPMFASTGVSRASMRGKLSFEDIGFRGLLDFGRMNTGAAVAEINYFDEISFDRDQFYQIPNFAMALEGINRYRVTNSIFDTVMRDQARCRSCYNALVAFNQFRHSDDDSVALHQSLSGAGNVREVLQVIGNTFEDTNAIALIGARSAIVSGNVCRRTKFGCVRVFPASGEGAFPIRNIDIADNIAEDVLNRPPFTAASSVFSVLYNPPTAPAGVTRMMPGAQIAGAASWLRPWNYDLASTYDTTAFAAGTRGVNIHDNQYMRTLPATPAYSSWGFGKVLTSSGFADVPVPDGGLLPTAGILASINAPDLSIHHDSIANVRRGIFIQDNPAVPQLTSLSLNFNTIFDAWESGITIAGTGQIASLDLIGNHVDVDPYDISPGRIAGDVNGGWTSGYGSSKCISVGVTVFAQKSFNTEADCYTTQVNGSWLTSNNILRGRPFSSLTGQLAYASPNYGIGAYPTLGGPGHFVANVATAGLPANLGASNFNKTTLSTAAPTSGWAAIGEIIYSSDGGACGCLGWRRLTTGTSWTPGVDYVPIPAGNSVSPTVAAAGTTQATATPLTAGYNDVTSGTGGVLLAGALNTPQRVVNDTSTAITVYPASGQSIGSGAANAGVSLAVGATGSFMATTATQIRQTP